MLPWPDLTQVCHQMSRLTLSEIQCVVMIQYCSDFFSLNYWFRARGKLSDDQALHRFVI
jgi:hypothetical protein